MEVVLAGVVVGALVVDGGVAVFSLVCLCSLLAGLVAGAAVVVAGATGLLAGAAVVLGTTTGAAR